MPDRMALISALLMAIVVLVALSATMLMREVHRRDLEARVAQAVWGGAAPADGAAAGVLGLLHALGRRVRRSGRFYSQKDIDNLQSMIAAAGLNPRRVLPIVLGGKLVLMMLLPMLAAAAAFVLPVPSGARVPMLGIGLVAGIMGPELVLRVLRRSYVDALQRGTPDALDLLVVCSEAGMGLESALERVSQEMIRSNRPMALALSALLDDLRVMPDRRAAFVNFGTRSGVEGLQRFATMVAQSLQFGTALGQALRAVAVELRRERMNRLEEKAVKLPGQLIFPLILFIMPSLYIILLGTSFLRLYDSLGTFISHLPTNH